jgi:hypothetical protein
MALVDADLKFTYIDLGTNGRISDGGVWAKCSLKEAIEHKILNIPEPSPISNDITLPYVIVADEAFPLKPYLMKPYNARDLNTERRIFNYRLSRSRRIVENAFGILANRWRIYHKPIPLKLSCVKKVVLATCALHNLLRSQISTRHIYTPTNLIDIENPYNGIITEGEWRQTNTIYFQNLTKLSSNMYSSDSKIIRDHFCNYFNTDGAISWQNKYL